MLMLTDLDGRVVEGPAEPAHGRVAVDLAGDGKLLQSGSAVDTLLTGVTLRRNCANNNVLFIIASATSNT